MQAIVSLSGGLDSTTVLAMAITDGCSPVQAVTFKYGSKHNVYERRAARAVANYYGVLLHEIDLTSVFELFSSALLKGQGEIPEGHYEDASMSQTVVPARNIIFASLLSGVAWSMPEKDDHKQVWLGIHQGDHAIYPDCRPAFFDAMHMAVKWGTDGRIVLRAPFLFEDKAGILNWGLKNHVPYALTRTCYKDQGMACGKCGACVERLEAFAKCDAIDPAPYVSPETA